MAPLFRHSERNIDIYIQNLGESEMDETTSKKARQADIGSSGSYSEDGKDSKQCHTVWDHDTG
jgi:hypothetical protein